MPVNGQNTCQYPVSEQEARFRPHQLNQQRSSLLAVGAVFDGLDSRHGCFQIALRFSGLRLRNFGTSLAIVECGLSQTRRR